MDIFFLRHGLAVDRGTPGFENDDLRPLTPKGKRQLRQTSAALRALELQFDAVLSSPLVRARQTAEALLTKRKLKKPLKLVDELKPGGDVLKLIQEITRLKPSPKNLLLVGHEPDLSGLISLLITGQAGAGIALKKGGLAKLKLERLRPGQCATLAWMLTPGQMKQMA